MDRRLGKTFLFKTPRLETASAAIADSVRVPYKQSRSGILPGQIRCCTLNEHKIIKAAFNLPTSQGHFQRERMRKQKLQVLVLDNDFIRGSAFIIRQSEVAIILQRH